jgi:hypothetical protein
MKKCISWFLMFVILSFLATMFSSFAASDEIIVYLDADSFVTFVKKNWPLMALFISESAALLPGKPKGIIQTVIFIAAKMIQKKDVSPKNLLS